MIQVTPRRNLLQRAANRAGRRFGIMPFPVAFEGSLEGAGNRSNVFDEIYQTNFWGSDESASGPGSELARTQQYREALLDLLKRRRITSMFDAPCGDLNWIPSVLEQYPLDYEGGDISERAIELARKRRPDLKLRSFDICRDDFPKAQLWHCRDTLFHLSFDDIWQALDNASRASFDFVLITTNRSRMIKNLDIASGDMRYLDLERAPFHFPPALEYLKDYLKGDYPCYVGLWKAQTLADVVARAGATGPGPRGGVA